MGDQPGSGEEAGPSDLVHNSPGLEANQGLPQGTSAPAVRTNTHIWSLVTGPEASNWSRLLVQDHLDSLDRYALFVTCKAARDMVLVTADEASVTLCVEEGEDSSLSLASLHNLRRALQTRGKLRTHLELDLLNTNQLFFALGVLEAGTTWLDELTINSLGNGEGLPAEALTTVGRCCRNLRILDVAGAPGMPSPEVFPELQELRVGITDDLAVLEDIYRTAAPYVSQLARLSLCTEDWSTPTPRPPPALLPLLLTPGTVASQLHILCIPGPLNDALLGMLLQSAPALKELIVCSVHLKTDIHAQAQVPWQLLAINSLHLSSLARLPSAPEMNVMLDGDDDEPPTLVCDITSITEAAAARLKGEDTECGSAVRIRPGGGMPAADTSAALHVGLSLLKSTLPQLRSIRLCGWTMTRAVVLELRQAPQLVKKLELGGDLVWLQQQPELYTSLLRLLPDSIMSVTIRRGAQLGALTDAQVKSICLGAPANRTPDNALRISLPGTAPELVQAIRLKLLQSILPHVRVVG